MTATARPYTQDPPFSGWNGVDRGPWDLLAPPWGESIPPLIALDAIRVLGRESTAAAVVVPTPLSPDPDAWADVLAVYARNLRVAHSAINREGSLPVVDLASGQVTYVADSGRTTIVVTWHHSGVSLHAWREDTPWRMSSEDGHDLALAAIVVACRGQVVMRGDVNGRRGPALVGGPGYAARTAAARRLRDVGLSATQIEEAFRRLELTDECWPHA